MLIPKYWAVYQQRFDKVDAKTQNKRQATIKRYGWSDKSQAEALVHAQSRVANAHKRWLAGDDILRRERVEEYNETNAIPIREQILLEQTFPEGAKQNNSETTQLIVTRNSYGAQVANVNNIAIIDVDNIDLLRLYYPEVYTNKWDSFFDDGVAEWPQDIDLAQVVPETVANPPHTGPAGISSADSKTKSWSGDKSAASAKSDLKKPRLAKSPAKKPHSLNPATENTQSMKPLVWVFVIASIALAGVITWYDLSWGWLIAFMVGMTVILWRQAQKIEQTQNQAEQQQWHNHLTELVSHMRQRINERLASHPNERFRLYQTPAGFRLIATHSTVTPSDTVVKDWLDHFHADSNYARLCQAQQCFRARLTAKPWRMVEIVEQNKLDKTLPHRNIWLVETETQRKNETVEREEWAQKYDEFAKGYKACRYLETLGGRGGISDPISSASNSTAEQKAIEGFVRWHDAACQVDSDLPMA
ncbi:hypothetical protein PSAR109036_06765 [Psychrobacter arenosus]|uniref:hypothetical protein n=1 Tax=Psychrobacter arenosus TaxID=256326 RepID=UPI0019188B1C|nr:hypothetical protein [Psychrobacter arenosus]